jgi:hypothetical protein
VIELYSEPDGGSSLTCSPSNQLLSSDSTLECTMFFARTLTGATTQTLSPRVLFSSLNWTMEFDPSVFTLDFNSSTLYPLLQDTQHAVYSSLSEQSQPSTEIPVDRITFRLRVISSMFFIGRSNIQIQFHSDTQMQHRVYSYSISRVVLPPLSTLSMESSPLSLTTQFTINCRSSLPTASNVVGARSPVYGVNSGVPLVSSFVRAYLLN